MRGGVQAGALRKPRSQLWRQCRALAWRSRQAASRSALLCSSTTPHMSVRDEELPLAPLPLRDDLEGLEALGGGADILPDARLDTPVL